MSEETNKINQPPKRFILQWHITHRCNLHCTHCYQDDYSKQAEFQDLLKILDKYEKFLKDNNFYGHIFLTGGEPLVSDAFFELISEIHKRSILCTVLSNGTLIGRKEANRIAWNCCESVQISLDGTREYHDSIRGEGSFDRAITGIDALVSQGVNVTVSFTAQKENYFCLKELAKICESHGVRKLWWDRVVDDRTEGNLSLSTDEFKKLCKTAGKLNRYYRRKNNGFYVSCERSLQFLKSGGNKCYSCHAGKDMITVLADGSVMPCRRLPFVIGNINNGEIESIIKSDEIVGKLSAQPIPKECSGCIHAEKCRGGAKCVTYAQTGNLYSKDINCFYKH